MKKLAAILLIAILFFNWYGYRLVTAVWEKDADKQLEVQLDNAAYDESQLIELRVALNVPYQTNQMEFERHYGEMELNGKLYTYVKRKIENGYLVLKCIPNESKQRIKTAGNDFFKLTNGLDNQGPSDKKEGHSSVAKSTLGEYDDYNEQFMLPGAQLAIHQKFWNNNSSLTTICGSGPEHPPQLFA